MKMKTDLRTALLAVIFLLSGFCASAQNETDFGTWSSIQINRNWAKPYAFLRGEHRSFRNASATEAWFVAAGGGYKFAPWLKADLSYEFWKLPVSGNPSVHKGVLAVNATLRRENLAFVFREKYELAYNASSGALSHTFRTRLRGQYAFDNVPLTPYVMYEYFAGAGQGWQRSLHYAGTEIRISRHHIIDIFYMYHLYGAGASVNSCHLLGLGYILNL